MTIFACMILGLLFIFIPFLPAVIEMKRGSDSHALKITNHILKDSRASPELVFWHIAHLLGVEDMDTLKLVSTVSEQKMLMESIMAIPAGLVSSMPNTVSRVISANSIKLSPRTNYLSKILALGSIETGAKNAINEIHAKERLTLGTQSKVMWWASAKDVHIQDQLDLPGKIQGQQSIRLQGRARFHHLDAPLIHTTEAIQEASNPFFVQSLTPPVRYSYSENCEVKPGETLTGDLIIKGNLILHEKARVQGSVKCHRSITLKPGAQVSGNIVSLGDLNCMGHNWIGGCILAQKTISFGPHCHVGSENQRVTVSATRLSIAAPFRSHGTLRAWISGSFI